MLSPLFVVLGHSEFFQFKVFHFLFLANFWWSVFLFFFLTAFSVFTLLLGLECTSGIFITLKISMSRFYSVCIDPCILITVPQCDSSHCDLNSLGTLAARAGEGRGRCPLQLVAFPRAWLRGERPSREQPPRHSESRLPRVAFRDASSLRANCQVWSQVGAAGHWGPAPRA